MKNPPPATQEGRDEFNRQLVRSKFMEQAHKEHYSHGLEGLFLKSDFTQAGIDACVYMKEQIDDRTDQTVLVQISRCLGKIEFMECQHMTPRYIRASKGMDVLVTPTASNASMIPDGPYRLLFYRVPKLQTIDIEKHLRNGIASPYGGLARIDLRYSGPHPGNEVCGINNMNWTYTDSVHDTKVDCTNLFNGTLPGDRTDDDISIVNAKIMHEDCFIFWYDKNQES